MFLIEWLLIFFYIADELEIHPHPEAVALVLASLHNIGIHFDRFDGCRFVANPEKMAHYPDDDEFAAQFLLN